MRISITHIERACDEFTSTKDGHDKTVGEVLFYLSFYINVSLRNGWKRVVYSEERHGCTVL